MAEFGGFEENWGLQAIVRGSRNDFSTCPDSCFGFLDVENDDHGMVFGFSDKIDFLQNVAILNDELQELYKPFYPSLDSNSSPMQDVHESNSVSIRDEAKEEPEEEVVEEEKQLHMDHQSSALLSTDASTPFMPTKYKRRKNQQKRVVLQVAAEGLSSDKWAWRKYGQKPIKSSPYPRSYYRCSSSKGCLARKQVEQSCTDPNIFIITYTAEHNHSQPTRKNALAGTTRQKFTTQKTPTRSDHDHESDHNKAAESNKDDHSTSAYSPCSMEEHGCSVKQESNVVGEEFMCDGVDDSFVNSSHIEVEDDFFSGLEDLDGLIAQLAGGQEKSYNKSFSMNFCSW